VFDHVEIKVSNISKSKIFFEKALAPLGVELLFSTIDMAGFGTGRVLGLDGKPRVEFLIETSEHDLVPSHIAFSASNRKSVEQFHTEGLTTGGRDNGKPGIRTDYHPGYYAAFLLDPDGNNIEAVVHTEDLQQ
jgi:catechol 2,3-dioxygenase-like lactoylglutathione lyase family enzyme